MGGNTAFYNFLVNILPYNMPPKELEGLHDWDEWALRHYLAHSTQVADLLSRVTRNIIINRFAS